MAHSIPATPSTTRSSPVMVPVLSKQQTSTLPANGILKGSVQKMAVFFLGGGGSEEERNEFSQDAPFRDALRDRTPATRDGSGVRRKIKQTHRI